MGWNVSSVAADEQHYFKQAIPGDAQAWVKIAKSTPAVNTAIQNFLGSMEWKIGGDGTQSRVFAKSWGQLMFVAASATFLDSNFTYTDAKQKERPLFPSRKHLGQMISEEQFRSGWNRLQPANITDEWMAFFFKTNPAWLEALEDFWFPEGWKEEWLDGYEPENLGEE